MMRDAILINQISAGELRELLRDIVRKENDELRIEVASLRAELRNSRTVVTHRQATFYFDSRVTPTTIIDYIW